MLKPSVSVGTMWDSLNFFHGWVPSHELPRVRSWALCFDDRTEKFFMVQKKHAQATRATRLPKLSACLRLCANFRSENGCSFQCDMLHVADEKHLIELSVDGCDKLTVDQDGNWMRLEVATAEVTCGLLFACTLVAKEGILSISPTLCGAARIGRCKKGALCCKIHVSYQHVPMPIKDDLVANTELNGLVLSQVDSDEADTFLEFLESSAALQTVGDLQSLTNATFDGMVQNYPDFGGMWGILFHVRCFDVDLPLAMAVHTFRGSNEERMAPHYKRALEALASVKVVTVGDLWKLKSRSFHALKIPALVMDDLERIRERDPEENKTTMNVINLADLPPKAFLHEYTDEVVHFRERHTHKSWRKNDATRPVITSAITYVDATMCRCSQTKRGEGSGGGAVIPSPNLGPRGVMTPGTLTARVSGNLTPTSSAHFHHASSSTFPAEAQEDFPAGSWCTCARKRVLAVNYELSTPSGSRCSEQNGLGKLASMGVPTHSIRELFVHGTMHAGKDPNPLFPCGVCENMFRRISKDVAKENGGGAVMLYMFDQERNPKRLIAMPVTEISHRDAAGFKKFVEDEVLDEGTDMLCMESSITEEGMQTTP